MNVGEENSGVVRRDAQAAARMQLLGEVLSGPGELGLALMCSSPQGVPGSGRDPMQPRVTGGMGLPRPCIILQGAGEFLWSCREWHLDRFPPLADSSVESKVEEPRDLEALKWRWLRVSVASSSPRTSTFWANMQWLRADSGVPFPDAGVVTKELL